MNPTPSNLEVQNQAIDTSKHQNFVNDNSLNNQVDSTALKNNNELVINENKPKSAINKESILKTKNTGIVEKDSILTENIITQENIDSTLAQKELVDTSAALIASIDSTINDVPAEINPPMDPYKPWLLSLSTGINFKKFKYKRSKYL